MTSAAQAVIEEDLELINKLLDTGNYGCVRYAAARKNGPLGSSIFKFGEDVNDFIIGALRSLAR